MAKSLFPFILTPALKNGIVVPNAKLAFYYTQTLTLAPIYNSSGVVQTNPVVADLFGNFPSVYIDTAVIYRIRLLTPTDVLIGNEIDPYLDGGDLSGSGGSAGIGYIQAGTGAVARTVQERLRETVSVKDFGAIGDDTADDTSAIQLAINFCQLNNRELFLPPGTYKTTSSLQISGSGNPITILGSFAPLAQGSTGPAAIIRYRGAAAVPAFNVNLPGTRFFGFAVQNFGNGTDAFAIPNGQHHVFQDISFIGPNGSTRWSRSYVYAENGSMGYGTVWNCSFNSAAPIGFFLDGSVHYGGGTPVEFGGRCIVESNSGFGAHKFIYVKATDYDSIHIHDCTFNQQQNAELRILDNTDTALTVSIGTLSFTDNELDIISNNVADRPFALKNIPNIKIDGNNLQCGAINSLARLQNSTVTSFNSNYVKSVGGGGLGIFDLDAASYFSPGNNSMSLAAMATGYIGDTGNNSGILPLAIATGDVKINLAQSLATGNGTYRLPMTTNVAGRFVVSIMTDSVKGLPTKGQEFTLQIVNTSGVNLTLLTAAANWKMAASALTGQVTGTTRNIRMLWDGVNVQQIAPILDIPN